MSDIEAGRFIERVEQLTLAVADLTKEMREFKEQAAYGKGVLWGMMTVAGMTGAGLMWLIGRIWH